MATQSAPAPSKSAKKKAAKAVERSDSPAPSTLSVPDRATDASSDAFETPYIKELQKSIRNINKKLMNTSKTEALVAQHPKKTLDELIAERIINTDQKAQIQKKPVLQSQLAQTEESLAQYIKVDEQYKAQAATDKAEREQAIEKAKKEALEEAEKASRQELRSHFLVLSQYLRLAAFRRAEEVDPESDESQAVEGALSAVYAGDESAVDAMMNLVKGSDEKILSLTGEPLQTSWNEVKSLSQKAYEESADVQAESEAQPEFSSDPTVVHATASELETGDLILTNGDHQAEAEASVKPTVNATVADDAANVVAESHWDSKNDMSASQESWVNIKHPRTASETEIEAPVTPAASTNAQSWADDHPEATQQTTPPAESGDGFHQVQGRGRGRHDREGSSNFRGGRGGRGQHRGGRGRGDGGNRGNRGNRTNGGQGGQGRGPRRNEES